MKFKDLTGKEHTFALDLSFKLKDETQSKSKPQFKLGQMLAKIYGSNNIFEDYVLPGTKLSWDFWVVSYKIAFEFDGCQHQKYTKFFHSNRDGFLRQKKADDKKQRLADINNIKLISMSKEVTLEELKQLIIGV